jgi:pSer/pThr/pTyr-binding forkhead associated (FHA) protein
MDVQLVVASGSRAGQVIPVTVEKFIIGRADDCHLKPRSELISRYHCAIISETGYVAIRDLGSKNGIFLNGERVSIEQELKNGDRIAVGPLDFFVHITVEVKGQKKPKVENIEQAVSRTVEIQSAAKPDEKETEIADWLQTTGNTGENEDTMTLDASDLAELMKPKDPPPEEEKGSKTDSHKMESTSRDTAANLLKNFFKGGR